MTSSGRYGSAWSGSTVRSCRCPTRCWSISLLPRHGWASRSRRSSTSVSPQVFQYHSWEPDADKGMPAEEMNSPTTAVNQLTELATSIAIAELHDRFAAFAEQYLAQAAESITGGTGT